MSLNEFQNKSIDIYGLINKKKYSNIQRNKLRYCSKSDKSFNE